MATRKPRSGDWDELTELLWVAARKGNVPAMRILRDEMRRDSGEGENEAPSVLDELASKRAKTAAG